MPSALSRAFGRRVEEFAADPVLRAYGVALALVHPLTAYFFLHVRPPLATIAAAGEPAVCWPFFPGCETWRVLDAEGLRRLVLAYGATAIGVAALWATGRVRAAWGVHLALEVVKLAIVALDFRLRLNQHYMALFAALAFLFWPRGRDTVRVLLVLIYVWAGALKLNAEWLSGAALYRQPWLVPPAWNAAACVYVVVLEMVVVWGLLARRGWIFWGALAQVALFHLVSFGVVGYFYPLLMFLLLTIFPLARHAERRAGDSARAAGSLLGRATRGGLRPAAYALLAGFSFLQLVPKLIPGESALTGEGRVFALHMFDAQVVCDADLQLHFADGSKLGAGLALRDPARIRCDPWLVLERAKIACREAQKRPGFTSFDLTLTSRLTSSPTQHVVVRRDRLCPDPPAYVWWKHNDWILLDGGS